MKQIIVSGKRKRAVARAVVSEGSGKVTVNKRDLEALHLFDKLKLMEPLKIAEVVLGNLKFNFSITVKGGGEKGQIEAARVALARAIVKASKSKELEKTFDAYDWSLLTADVRRKEAYKPGDSKARSKRQKSFR